MSHPNLCALSRYGGVVRRNSYALAALATAGIPGIIPVATRLVSTAESDIDTAQVRDDRNRMWVVTNPTTPAAGARVAKDVEVLEALSGTELAPLIQSPQGFASIPEGGRAVIALALEGEVLTMDEVSHTPELAGDMGRVLATIHNTPQWATREAGVEEFSTAQIREQHRKNILRANAAHTLPAAVAQRWKLMLTNEQLWDFTPRFIHGSLSEERLRAANNSISGVLGWDNAAVGDPAVDIAWVLSSLDHEAFDTFFTAYTANLDIRPDTHLLERAQLAGEFAVLDWLLAGIDTGAEDIVDDALGMLDDIADDLAEIARHEAEHELEHVEHSSEHGSQHGTDQGSSDHDRAIR